MKKKYWANVAVDMVDYFENKAREKRVTVVSRTPIKTSKGDHIYHYELEAEEGVIKPEYQIQ